MSSWRDDAILRIPKKQPPKTSWWAEKAAQDSREQFSEWARAEQDRIIGNARFGGGKKVIDSFPQKRK